MLKSTSGVGQCSQQKFTTAGLLALTNAGREEIGRLISTCIQRKGTPGREIDVEVALGVMALSLCSKLRIAIDEVACAQGPLINFALTHLASDSRHWRAAVEGEELGKFHSLFSKAQGEGLRHRGIQELLGIQERRAHRYLVRRPGESWAVSDDIGGQIGSAKEPFILVFDAVALADKLSTTVAGPFFTWEP